MLSTRLPLLLVFLTSPLPALADETPPKPNVVATVNGKELTEPEFWRRCERMVGGASDTAVGYHVLREWLQQTLAEEEAARKGLLPTSQDVEKRVRAVRRQFEVRGQDLDEWLASRGRTQVTFREDLRQQLIVENLLTEGVTVTDAEVVTYYSNNKALLGVGEQIRISRITVDTREAAREAEAALKKGTPFEQVARKYSIDPFRNNGGRIPDPIEVTSRADRFLEPEVMEKALRLEVGKVAGPIKLDEEWVFVRLEEKLPARAPELPDVQDLILANLKVQKGGPARLKAAQERINQLQREAKVEIFRPEYRHLLKAFQKSPD